MNRKFSPKTFNQLWVTDITEFALPIKGKKLYLSTIMDCYNSEVIARSPNLAIAINPLNKALEEHHHNLNQLVVHSDQGFHYQHSLQLTYGYLMVIKYGYSCNWFFIQIDKTIYYYKYFTPNINY